jgi:hypothetical protein
MADRRNGKQWTARWLLGAALLVALLAVAVALAPVTYSTESSSCGSVWSPDYPDQAMRSGGGCGYWLNFMTRASFILLVVALGLASIATWKLIRASDRSDSDAVPVS